MVFSTFFFFSNLKKKQKQAKEKNLPIRRSPKDKLSRSLTNEQRSMRIKRDPIHNFVMRIEAPQLLSKRDAVLSNVPNDDFVVRAARCQLVALVRT